MEEEAPTVRLKSWIVDHGDFYLELFGVQLGPWRARIYMRDVNTLVPVWSIGPVPYEKARREGMRIIDELRGTRKAA